MTIILFFDEVEMHQGKLKSFKLDGSLCKYSVS